MRSWVHTGNPNLDKIIGQRLGSLPTEYLFNFFKDFESIDDFLSIDHDYPLLSFYRFCSAETFQNLIKNRSEKELTECFKDLIASACRDDLLKIQILSKNFIMPPDDCLKTLAQRKDCRADILDFILTQYSFLAEKKVSFYYPIHTTNLYIEFFDILLKHKVGHILNLESLYENLLTNKKIDIILHLIKHMGANKLFMDVFSKVLKTKMYSHYIGDFSKLKVALDVKVFKEICQSAEYINEIYQLFEFYRNSIEIMAEDGKWDVNMHCDVYREFQKAGIKIRINDVKALECLNEFYVQNVIIDESILQSTDRSRLQDYHWMALIESLDVNKRWPALFWKNNTVYDEEDCYPIDMLAILCDFFGRIKPFRLVVDKTKNPPATTLTNIIRLAIKYRRTSYIGTFIDLFIEKQLPLDEPLNGMTPLNLLLDNKNAALKLIQHGASIYNVYKNKCAFGEFYLAKNYKLEEHWDHLKSLNFKILDSPVLKYIYEKSPNKALSLIIKHKYFNEEYLLKYSHDVPFFSTMLSFAPRLFSDFFYQLCHIIGHLPKADGHKVLQLAIQHGANINYKYNDTHPIDLVLKIKKKADLALSIMAAHPTFVPNSDNIKDPITFQWIKKYKEDGYFFDPATFRYFIPKFKSAVWGLYLLNKRLRNENKVYAMPKFILFLIVQKLEMIYMR